MNNEAIRTESPELLTPELNQHQPLIQALERAEDEITSFKMQQPSNVPEHNSLNKANSQALLPHVGALSALLNKLDSLNENVLPNHVQLDDFPDLINLSGLEDSKSQPINLSHLDKTITRASIFTCTLCFGASLHSSITSFSGNMGLLSATYTAGWVAITSFWARSTIALIREKPKKNQWLTNAAKRSSIFTSISLGAHAVLSTLFPNVVPPIRISHTVVQVLCSCFWYFIDEVNQDKRNAIGNVEMNSKDQRYSIESSLKDYNDKQSTFLSTLATEVEDATIMLTATLHYFSPSRILEGSNELLTACSIPVPIASISAINTTTKQVRYLSSHLPLLARLSLAQTDVEMNIGKSTVEMEFDIGEMLQAVGDAMAGFAAKLDVKLVIYHSDNALHYTNVRGDEDVLRHTLINVCNTLIQSHPFAVYCHINSTSLYSISSGLLDLYQLVRNLLDSCTAGSCIELGLNVTPLTSDTESSSSRLLIAFTMTLELSSSSESSLLPNANLTSRLLAYLGGSFALENVSDTCSSFVIRLEMNEGNRSEKVHEMAERPHERLHRQLSNIRFSDEPTLEELTSFVNRLSGVKVVLYAADQSIFAKHLTSCLASWNVNISHVSVIKSTDEDSYFRSNDSEVTTPGSEASAAHSSSLLSSVSDSVNPRVEVTSPLGEQNLKTVPPTFILIDDDVHTLEQQLHEVRAHAAIAQAAQTSRRHKRSKSNAYSTHTTAIIHFTSLSEYKKVRDAINWFNAVSVLHPHGVPQIIVVPKPAGPRRFLTAFHTAWSNAVVEPQYLPIATSPSSPMTPNSQKSIWNGGLITNLPSPSHGVGLDESGIPNEGGVHLQRRAGSGIYSPPVLPNEEGSNYFTATGSGSKVASPSGLHAHEVQGSPTGVSTAEGVLFDPSNKSASSSVSSASGSRSGITRSYRSGSTSIHGARRRSNADLRGGSDPLVPGGLINLPAGFHQPPLDQVSPGGSPLKVSITAAPESPLGTPSPSPHPSIPKSTLPVDAIVSPDAKPPLSVRSAIDIPPPVHDVVDVLDAPEVAPNASVSSVNKPIAERSLAMSRRRRKEKAAPSGVSSPPISVLIVEGMAFGRCCNSVCAEVR